MTIRARQRKQGLALAAFAVIAASLASDVASADETPPTPAPTKPEGIQFVDSWSATFSCYGKVETQEVKIARWEKTLTAIQVNADRCRQGGMAIWEGDLTKDVVTASDFPLYLQVKVTWNGGTRPNGRLTIDSPNHMTLVLDSATVELTRVNSQGSPPLPATRADRAPSGSSSAETPRGAAAPPPQPVQQQPAQPQPVTAAPATAAAEPSAAPAAARLQPTCVTPTRNTAGAGRSTCTGRARPTAADGTAAGDGGAAASAAAGFVRATPASGSESGTTRTAAAATHAAAAGAAPAPTAAAEAGAPAAQPQTTSATNR